MRNTILYLLLFLVPTLYGQENNLKKETAISVGYFGETITHKGVNVGLEKHYFADSKYKMIVSANAGYYIHQRNNTSIFLRGQWGQRVQLTKGVFIENFLGVGYLHQFSHGGELYEVLPNGAVVEKKKRGNPKLMPSVAIGGGYLFPNKRIAIYVRPELFWKAPFNGYFLTHFALNTGLIFNLYGNE